MAAGILEKVVWKRGLGEGAVPGKQAFPPIEGGSWEESKNTSLVIQTSIFGPPVTSYKIASEFPQALVFSSIKGG